MEDRDRWNEGGANVIACAVRQPARGLMTLRSDPEVSSQHGVSALVEENVQNCPGGELALWGGRPTL